MLKNDNKLKNTSLFKLRHVAIIMDGNGRWATNRGKIRSLGHKEGIKSIIKSINFSIKNNFEALTLFAFSTENCNRPKKEIYFLIKLFIQFLKNETKNLHKNNIKLKIIGDRSCFNLNLKKYINYAELLTSNNKKLILNIAVNYGGRWDILEGIKKIIKKVKLGKFDINLLNENILNNFFCINKLPTVDLVIRTGGEIRISNFLLWQIAYSELFFTNVLWPDFNDEIFNIAIQEFNKRKRNFGNIINK